MDYPSKIHHWIDNQEYGPADALFFSKIHPALGKTLGNVVRGNADDVSKALDSAEHAYKEWNTLTIVRRAEILRNAVLLIQEKKQEIAEIVAAECGKSVQESLGEVGAGIECGFFFAGEGRRYFGKTLTSGIENRFAYMIRQSIGVGALFTPLNNPFASICWKAFPALLCGNSVVVKAHEDTPYVPVWFGKILMEAGVTGGAYSVLQGFGKEIGEPLLHDKRVEFVSFTGSLETGKKILQATSDRLVKVSIEAGGKNPLVICDDANLELAVNTAVSAAFVDAGQRCASASRIIVFDAVYDQFKNLFLEKVNAMQIGDQDGDAYGAIINEKRMDEILGAVEGAVHRGAALLSGGKRLEDKKRKDGFFIAPTVLENVPMDDEVSCKELFGPVTVLYKVKDFEHAVEVANASEYKLSGAIHTKSLDRAQEFIKRYTAGVVRVNGPTHGSEPHMPFGGVGLSGNGWREPGELALDFYSEWKQVTIEHNQDL